MKLKVALAAERKAVDPVVQRVMEVVRSMHCAVGKEDDIELALTEALANAVVHGAKEDPNKIVECIVACDEERGMLIVVRDPGTGFDPGKGSRCRSSGSFPESTRPAPRCRRSGPLPSWLSAGCSLAAHCSPKSPRGRPMNR